MTRRKAITHRRWQCWLLLLSLSVLNSCEARSPFLSKHFRWWGHQLRGGSSLSQDSTTVTTNNDPNAQPPYRYFNHTANIPQWKRDLPEPLCYKKAKTLQRICIPYQNQVAEIYLLGTAHVSNDSSRDVKLLLQTLAPDVIFVELCDQRTSLMEDPPEALQPTLNNHTTSFWQKVNQIQLQTNNSKFQCMATVLLTSTQEEYAESLGVELGGEFRAAYKYWRSFLHPPLSSSSDPKRRPHMVLGDRPLAITLARCWESLSWFGKLKVLAGLLFSSFSKPDPEELRAWIQKILEDDETDLLKASLEDLRKHFPTLERVIIQERDAYMACKLYQLCRGMLVSAARRGSEGRIIIAALVGAGHVPGICEWLTNKSHPQGPEELLASLIATKKYEKEDLSQLVFDVTELQDLPVDQIAR
jgi:pheromone shutdown protein TraB